MHTSSPINQHALTELVKPFISLIFTEVYLCPIPLWWHGCSPKSVGVSEYLWRTRSQAGEEKPNQTISRLRWDEDQHILSIRLSILFKRNVPQHKQVLMKFPRYDTYIIFFYRFIRKVFNAARTTANFSLQIKQILFMNTFIHFTFTGNQGKFLKQARSCFQIMSCSYKQFLRHVLFFSPFECKNTKKYVNITNQPPNPPSCICILKEQHHLGLL